ncbi:DUF4834 family protein [Porphyromonas sp. COT-239 OH1446]|uniref:DUF4834 family protein n=1 Tax=Porphyromonas sp. COT-239 OH1446 TaxID=1515613 RepID=UPI00052DE477|nr:DUF4834 family protein [Porphyromonas sp. COT-239 OH1446]KGN68393.1 hypothetical protein HQ37_06305 [Porphyromonas sp. COT-239 OH1446]
MEVILILLVILFVLSQPSVRAWIAIKLFGYVQQRVQRQMQEQMRARSSAQQRASREQSGGKRDKVDLGQVEARKFDKTKDAEYVDFEELPK